MDISIHNLSGEIISKVRLSDSVFKNDKSIINQLKVNKIRVISNKLKAL